MGICQSKKKQHPKDIVIIQAFSAPQLILQENQAVKPSHPRTKSESQYLTVRRASRKTENEVPTPSSFMKSPLIICKDKSNVFDLQRGFFKKYTTLKFIETEQTLYCQHNVTAQYVKVTILDMNSENNQKFFKQIKQYNLQCPNICQFLETFQERDQIYLVQEHFKGGTLSSLLESGTLGYDKAIQIINQIIQAINFLHCLNLIHGSLTLDSFSVSDQNNLFVKLSDLNPIFNFEKQNADEQKRILIAQYKSPENDRSIKNDVWAIGIIIHQLLTSESPLQYEKLKWKPTEKLTNTPQDGVLALQSMLDPNPEERCSLKEIIEKQYFKANINSDTLQQSIVNLAHAKKMTQFQSTIVFFMMNKFQAEQVQILTKLFDQGDLDNDGLLDKKELEYLFKIIIPDDEIFIKSQIDSIFLNIDVDNSGAISVNEFVTAASNKKELLQEYNLEGCFRILCNNQGGITAKSIARKIQINENAIKSEIQDYVCDQIDLNTFKEIMKELI